MQGLQVSTLRMSRCVRLDFRMRLRGTEIGAGKAVMPGECIFVPQGPEKSQETRPGGQEIADAAKQHLSRSGLVPGLTHDLQAAAHHSRRRSTKHREERKILQIHDGERCDADRRT